MARRVAISGGPGGGKSTVAAAVAREHGARVVVVPEVATHLLAGFFPGIQGPDDRRAVQRAIYHVQVNLEAVHRARADENTVLVFDRGVIDGAAYWPEGSEAFFEHVCGDAEEARDRYDAVLFLESAAQGGIAIGNGNVARTEQQSEAARLDATLYALWSPHPGFRFVAHTPTFEAKVQNALAALRSLIAAG
ncbi:MAG TPA: ATP-binding protein [Polyangiaceae bacterium]|nr:ATP-binding protein [Polyangiaceae bacterium]